MNFSRKKGLLNFGRGKTQSVVVEDYVIRVNTKMTGSGTTTFILPIFGTYDYRWEADLDPSVNGSGTGSGNKSFSFPSSGIYKIFIKGTGASIRIRFNNTGDKLKIIEILNWGTTPFDSFNGAYWGCENLVINANDEIKLISGASMYVAFTKVKTINTPLKFNSTSGTTNFDYMFSLCKGYNSSLDNFDLSSATNVSGMFEYLYYFNQSINGLDFSKATSLQNLLINVSTFNKDVDITISNCTNLSNTFFNTNIQSIILRVCSKVTAIGVTSFPTTVKTLLLYGLAQNFYIHTYPSLKGVDIDNLALSVADLKSKPSKSIRMSVTQKASCDNSLWTNKNWTITT